jgi:hypothetical protein
VPKFSDEDDALLDELGIEVEPERTSSRTPREERIIAGFEDIQRFYSEHGRPPQHGEDRDIFERLYAVRLDRLRDQEECRALLTPMDHQGLLTVAYVNAANEIDALDDDALLAALGVDTAVPEDIGALHHVRSAAEKRAAEEIANRERCEDFERFKPLFDQVQSDLKDGLRSTRSFVKDTGFSKAEIKEGQFFILGGQTAYVAKVGDPIKAPNGESDARLRVIYSNGTESDLLLRSLQRALYKDDAGRRITEPEAGPLFSDQSNEDDSASGIVYVLRSRSENPAITAHREILHKIGVTGGDVERRIANARLDPTFLLADVEIVATYELYNINRTRLENLIHRIFGAARLDVEIKDRFGNPVIPREWFLVPLFVINEAIERIRNGTITGYTYDPKSARLVPA